MAAAGSLNERIEFYDEISNPTPSGFIDKTYSPVYKTWASRKKQKASEGDGLDASEEFTRLLIILQVRATKLIKKNQRILYCGEFYKIIDIDFQIQDDTYLITCTKINE